MDDDNVQNIPSDKQGKNPLDGALNRLREEKLKEASKEFNDAVKVAYDAKKVADNAMDTLKEKSEKLEEVKAELADFAKLIKG